MLTETYGVIIYQEQVMKIAQILAGYSLGEADLLRRAMGKKKKEEMDFQRARFVKGAWKRPSPRSQSGSIFDLVAKFAGYGFNKSHAAAYALISFQTAWLKANHAGRVLRRLDEPGPVEHRQAGGLLSGRRNGSTCRCCSPDINRSSSADFDVAWDDSRRGGPLRPGRHPQRRAWRR